MRKLPENFVVIDLETTGLDPEACGILEIGAVDASGRRFYRRVALERGRRVEWQALDCNGIDPLDLGAGVSIDTAMAGLAQFLRAGSGPRWIMGGKNPQFDYGFLKAHWPEGVIGVPLSEVISRRCVDLHSLVYGNALINGDDMADPDFSTDDLYKQYDLQPEPMPHNALRGALHEMEGFCRVLLGMPRGLMQPKLFETLMQATDRENIKLEGVE